MKKQKQEQTGQVNFVWALAGGYLIYLGGKLLYSLYRDGTDSSPVLVVIPAAAVFIGVGFWLPGMEGVSVRRRPQGRSLHLER